MKKKKRNKRYKKKNFIEKLKEFFTKEKKEKNINNNLEEDELLEEKEGIRVKKKNKNKSNKKQKKDNKYKWWQKVLVVLLLFIILCIIMGCLFFVYIALSAGKFDPDKLLSQDQTVVYDANGDVVAKLGLEKRESVKYEELPQVFVDAIIATEDSRFFQHNGVDMARFMKASALQLLGRSDAGGASTLTMQVSKNNLTDTNSSGIKGIIRKFKDVYISVFQIEKKYTKKEIIEFYVNDNCLGGRIFGVGEASKYYFGKSVGELSLPEASLLAGMFQSPNGYHPYKNPEAAYNRRKTVLNLMVRHRYITKEEADMANSIPIEDLLVGVEEESDYQGYIDTVVTEIEDKTGDNPYSVPMKIYTAMDKDIQNGIDSVLNGEETDFTWIDDAVQAGVAVVDVNNGEIKAIGAGRNREQGWNYATQAKRQPGSTAKPLFDYGPGFEYNNFSTYTLFNDEPWAYSDGTEIGNWDGSYEGLITLRRALSVSRNIPALKAFQQIDKKNIIDFVTKLGIEVEKAGNSIHEAHSIGGFNPGASPLQMAGAYAAFASGGYYNEPHAVVKIEYRSDGETVEFKKDKEKVMSSSTAYLMNNVLKYAVDYGFNGGAKVSGSTVAAKTGTSNLDSDTIKRLGLPEGAVNDLWTVAYTPEYSVALWYGYETVTQEHYLSGASAPKDTVMRSIMKYIPTTTKEFEMPDTVVASQVEFGTWPAQLPSEYTPSDLIRTEYFKKGTQPTEVSPRFSKLSDVTNLKSSVNGRTVNLTWDYAKPETETVEYLNKYYSQSVFGNGTNAFVQQRLNYGGELGFGIYKKDSSGNLDLIEFVTTNKYTYNAPYTVNSRNLSLVVKVQYASFTSNASNGVEAKVTLNGGSQDDQHNSNNDNGNTNTNSDKLVIEVPLTNLTPGVNEPIDLGYTVKYGNEDVTSEISNAKYKLINGNSEETYTTKEALEAAVNDLPVGIYTVEYEITYNNEVAKKSIKVQIHE